VLTLSDDDLDNLKKTIQNAKRGMILVGSLRSKKQAQMILAFAEKIRWPVICDIESFMRGMSSSKNIIKHFELLLRSDIKPNVDVLIHFGDRVVSKKIDSWISSHCKDHVHITEHFHRFDPSHNISSRYTCSTLWLCNKLLELSTSLPHQDHLEELVELCETISTALRASLSSYEMIHEPYIPYMLSCSNLSGYGVFFSNSMPIRDADNFFYPSAEEVEVFVTRGMSGIDGNISIVQGITSHLARPMIAVVGDLTFLHDIGSLEKLSHSLYPIIIFVINNGGGGIFSFLPIVKKEKEFEEFFATAHINRFEKVSEFAGVEFFCPRNTFELDELWNDLQDNPRTCVIEVLTNREQNVKIHEELFDRVKNQLCAQSIHAAL
jgi:2-succinyl-5-enolpyruvyl-6-hydroxy-3-cyclohexene-1-carboxylate synthase